MNSVSLCMIVKNEEKNIKNCLESISPYVDEIIIIDTGSTDNTKKICEAFPVQLYDYPWSEDFSDARNFSISKAACDWIFWMDADEILINKPEKRLSEMVESDAKLYSIKMVHYDNSIDSPDYNYHTSYNYRLFKNDKSFRFVGKIHEQLMPDNLEVLEEVPILEIVELHHIGYLIEYTEEKIIRNLSILAKEKEASPTDPWIHYHIAVELYRLNKIDMALQFIDLSIIYFLQSLLKPPALIYKLKYSILCTFCRENAYKGIEKAIELYPDYVDLHFYRGLLLYQEEKYEDAAKAFSYCILLGEYNPKYLITSGAGTYNAFYYLGECYTKMNNTKLAKISFNQALLYNPNFEKALTKLKALS